jgi:hypothetical protein
MKVFSEFRRLRSARRANENVSDRLHGLMDRAHLIAWAISFWVIAQWSLGFPETLADFSVFDLEFTWSSIREAAALLFAAAVQFTTQQWPYLILAGFTYWWFANYRDAVEHEIGIVDGLFPPSLKPKRWQKVTDRTLFNVLSVLIVLTFLALAAALQRLEIYVTIVMGLWLQDTLGNASIRRNLRPYLDDATYHLPYDHPDAEYYRAKREIARAYWIDQPHLERIALLIFLTVIVMMSAISDRVFEFPLPAIVPTGLMSAIILGNELTMKSWRLTRDADLLEAEAAHNQRVAAAAEAEQDPPQTSE